MTQDLIGNEALLSTNRHVFGNAAGYTLPEPALERLQAANHQFLKQTEQPEGEVMVGRQQAAELYELRLESDCLRCDSASNK
ncbi:hypothetical protein [Arthrobacter rhizosphaerae]|uniref:hypothetical protein n=1 Tax=Arthrobacter rhizosphaerae TaxID=2855490 RepID=UPI001FF39AA6|nr:hypothetical protein [Arthrobacter rhizosphaerae]